MQVMGGKEAVVTHTSFPTGDGLEERRKSTSCGSAVSFTQGFVQQAFGQLVSHRPNRRPVTIGSVKPPLPIVSQHRRDDWDILEASPPSVQTLKPARGRWSGRSVTGHDHIQSRSH